MFSQTFEITIRVTMDLDTSKSDERASIVNAHNRMEDTLAEVWDHKVGKNGMYNQEIVGVTKVPKK